jgi:uncharacterized protein (DUF608 family)
MLTIKNKKLILGFLLIIICLNVFAENKYGHMIPETKNLSEQWFSALTDDSGQKLYKGEQLKTIGMPVGGIASGQLYVRGDGTLACWWIANNAYNTGDGHDKFLNFNTAQGPWQVCYQTFEPFNYFKQGFDLEIGENGKTVKIGLNKKNFNNIEFIGEYPVAEVKYKTEQKLPFEVSMQCFSPFIPLDLRNSANPATILKFKIKNKATNNLSINLSGFIQNMVMADLKNEQEGQIRNFDRSVQNRSTLYMDFVPKNSTLKDHPYFGNMSLSLLEENGYVITSETGDDKKELKEELVGRVGKKAVLKPNQEIELKFLLTWYFPNRPDAITMGWDWNNPISTKGKIRGNMYANWYASSLDVVDYIESNYKNLESKTFKFREDWYQKSTLPYWLKQRIMMPVSTLATETYQWYADNKFMAWEGVGSCVGNCTHVYNYAHAQAFLFPELERNVREKSDFGVSFLKDGGVMSRDGREDVFIDGHLGAILKAYREYLLSKDKLFLSRNWQKVKKSMQFAIKHDENSDGLIEKVQRNTYDIAFGGANTYVGSLYLAALKATEKMAIEIGDEKFAKTCCIIYNSGRKLTVKKLWNGQYFIQDVDLKKYPKHQYAKGCLSDQLFGQTWAHILGLGYLYPKEKVKKTLESIWKYNWTTDVWPHVTKYKPERDYALEGEAGLINCTWPLSPHMKKSGVRYRNEVWTGIEYQVATSMIYNDMIDEGLSIAKAVHDRYSPEKHNPWNEVECGDHYGRAMASWGIHLSLQDYLYNGSEASIRIKPKLNKENYKGLITTANAWGMFEQKLKSDSQNILLSISSGQLKLSKLRFEKLSNGKKIEVLVNNNNINFKSEIINDMIEFSFESLILKEKDLIKIIFK